MDSVSGSPLTHSRKNSIQVIVDCFMKCAHFIVDYMTYLLDKLVDLYISEIVRLHSVSKSIVSDRD